jgi:hypothetical protein
VCRVGRRRARRGARTPRLSGRQERAALKRSDSGPSGCRALGRRRSTQSERCHLGCWMFHLSTVVRCATGCEVRRPPQAAWLASTGRGKPVFRGKRGRGRGPRGWQQRPQRRDFSIQQDHPYDIVRACDFTAG